MKSQQAASAAKKTATPSKPAPSSPAPKPTGSKQALAEKDQRTAIAESTAIDFSSDAGMGMEGVDKDSMAIPFLAIMQGLTPQLETLDGAKIGMIFNTVTNDLYAGKDDDKTGTTGGVLVVPCAFRRRYLRWMPRGEGGGFRGELEVGTVEALIRDGKAATETVEINGKDRELLMYEGTILQDTRMHYVLIVNDGAWFLALMSLSRTQVKRSKRWIAQMNGIQLQDAKGKPFNPPSFSHVYRIKTEKEENDEGSWYSFVTAVEEPVTDGNLYAAAKAFNKQVVGGKVIVDHAAGERAAGSEDETATENGNF